MLYLKILKESFIQSFQQLSGNKLRTFLSLLGVTIGVFCIIAVQSAVGSLEENIRKSFSKLGTDVIYISKFPWAEDPGDNFWKYSRRPNPGLKEYKALSKTVNSAQSVCYSLFIARKTIKYQSASADQCYAVAVTEEYDRFQNLEYQEGRFFTGSEYQTGAPKAIIGDKVATALFGEADPLGKKIKCFGRDLEIIGVFKKSGKDLINFMNKDQVIMISLEFARSVTNVNPNLPFGGGNVQLKAATGVPEQKLKDDATVALRAAHFLKPRQDNDFSINSMTAFEGPMNATFAVLNTVGFIIGIFALLVGMFSVANIMFVSVKERTNIIGIKKALGAKSWIILQEFLIESIILCVAGGLVGLGLVFIGIKLAALAFDFDLHVSYYNMALAVAISIIVGVLAGMIPAIQASKMDPVEAIRA